MVVRMLPNNGICFNVYISAYFLAEHGGFNLALCGDVSNLVTMLCFVVQWATDACLHPLRGECGRVYLLVQMSHWM
jgi:hypothetical protein